jgi:hypothetical protein
MLISSEISTSWTEARIVVARSSAISTSMPGGIDFTSSGNRRFTLSMTSRMFAPGWRRTIAITVRSPSYQPATRWFSTSSVTVAISESRTSPTVPGAADDPAAEPAWPSVGAASPGFAAPVPGGPGVAGAPWLTRIVWSGAGAGAATSPGLPTCTITFSQSLAASS